MYSALVAARARALYIMGPIDGAKALTMDGSFQDFVGRAGSLEYVMSFDRLVLEDLARIRDEATKTRAALRDQRAEAIKQRNEIAERVQIVAELADTQQDAHDHLSTSINAYRSQLAALQREQSRILSIINSRGSRGRISGVPSKMGFAWPTSSHHINSAYGPRWGGFHTGVDIQCHSGQSFAASKAGKVIEAGWAGGYGNTTIIDHGNGYTSLYAHQSSIGVRRGQRVDRGRVIGRCGSTGNSTGAHLHFEIRYNGNHRNPMWFLP
jgi:murein DD-endopeptidase MepM/ murein hydrolase activator NlpD